MTSTFYSYNNTHDKQMEFKRSSKESNRIEKKNQGGYLMLLFKDTGFEINATKLQRRRSSYMDYQMKQLVEAMNLDFKKNFKKKWTYRGH